MHNLATPGIENNSLIATLNPADRALFQASSRIVRLRTGTILYQPGDLVGAAYFPLNEAVAMINIVMDNGAAVEIGMIGREGALGGIVSSGKLAAFARTSVMYSGHFVRIDCAALEALKATAPPIRNLMNRYADCILAQTFQSVGCNAAHSLEKRAAKLLCAAVDRTGGNAVVMTQEQFGSLLGIARSYASRLIQRLRGDGLLETRRGGLVITDVEALRLRSCGCDDLVRAHFEQVLAGIYPETATGHSSS